MTHRATISVVPSDVVKDNWIIKVDGKTYEENGQVRFKSESEANAKKQELEMAESKAGERQVQEMIRKYGFSSEEGECSVATVNSAIRKVVNELASTPAQAQGEPSLRNALEKIREASREIAAKKTLDVREYGIALTYCGYVASAALTQPQAVATPLCKHCDLEKDKHVRNGLFCPVGAKNQVCYHYEPAQAVAPEPPQKEPKK